MLRTKLVARLFPRLFYQLVPAALVTTVGVLLLGNLAKPPDTAPAAAPVEIPINAEAVFKIVPREPAEVPAVKAAATARPVTNPKPNAATPRKPASERQVASAPAPLPIVQIPEPPQAAAPAAPAGENGVMETLRNTTATVQRIPQWAARSVAGWFSADAPPRPPASVPAQNFQTAM